MKINPDHPVSQTNPGSAAKTRTDLHPSRFAQALAHAAGTAARVSATATSISPPLAARPAMMSTEAVACQRTENVLDAMAHYQRDLGDRHATLRAVEPSLQRMQAAVSELEPMLADLPADDPLKVVAGQALTLASKEIARFEGGYYIDD